MIKRWFIFIPLLVWGIDFKGESHYLKARAYEKQGDLGSAIIEYKKALEYDPSSITLKKSLAYCYLYNNEEELGLSILLPLAKTQKDAGLWRTIGDIYHKNKRYKIAIEAYKRGLEIKEDINLLYNLAEAYLFAKQIDNAILTYKSLITLFPQEEPALLSLGMLYDTKGDTKEAGLVYKRILEINPKNIFALQRLIRIYLKEDPNLAETPSLKLIEIEESPQSFLLLGIAKEKNKKDKDAESCYWKVVNAGCKEGYIRLGWLLFKNERDDEGLRLIKNGLSLFPNDFDLSILYGVFLSQNKEYQASIDIFKKLIKEIPDDDYLYFQLAIAYDGLSNKDWAIKYLYKALRLNPKNAGAYNYIGYSWLELDKNLSRALRLIEKALEIEPDNPAYIDSLGWCYYKMGNYELALSLLLKAYNLKNDDPVVNEHIGDVYNELGMKEDACKFFKLSLDKFKEEKDRERIRNKLKLVL